MYSAGTDYINYINSSCVRTPKSKIVVGTTTYTGESDLLTWPKIEHKTTAMIGGFPAKTCSFEIRNPSGTINLNGKEVTVYRGLEINGSTHWIPMGIFSAEDGDVVNSSTKRSITFNGTDRSSRFDGEHQETITYPCTLLRFVQEICRRVGVILETESFPLCDLTLDSAPNTPSSYTDRQLIAHAAELGGCIAQISRTGGLIISRAVYTGVIINKNRYSTLSVEPQFGGINALALGHSDYDDDIVKIAAGLATSTSVNQFRLGTGSITPEPGLLITSDGERLDVSGTPTRTWIIALTNATLEYDDGADMASFAWDDLRPDFSSYNNNVYRVYISGTSTGVRLARQHLEPNNAYSNQYNEPLTSGLHPTAGTTIMSGSKLVRCALVLEPNNEYNFEAMFFYGQSHSVEPESYPDDFVKFEYLNLCEWRIEDNPFIEDIRSSIIESVFTQISGLSIIPFNCSEFIDDYLFDLNDTISIQKKDGSYFNATVLQLGQTSRIRSSFSAETQDGNQTDLSVAGGLTNKIRNVNLKVDYNENQIRLLAEDVSGLGTELRSSIVQSAENILISVAADYATKTNVSTQLEVLNDSVNFRFLQKGKNLIPNSSFELSDSSPTSWLFLTGANTTRIIHTAGGFDNGNYVSISKPEGSTQNHTMRSANIAINPADTYTFSFYYKSTLASDLNNLNASPIVEICFGTNDTLALYTIQIPLEAQTEWTRISRTFTPNHLASGISKAAVFFLLSSSDAVLDIDGVMFEQSDTLNSWTGAPDEYLTYHTTIDSNGVAVCNGALSIYDINGTQVLGANANGNGGLSIIGNLRTVSCDTNGTEKIETELKGTVWNDIDGGLVQLTAYSSNSIIGQLGFGKDGSGNVSASLISPSGTAIIGGATTSIARLQTGSSAVECNSGGVAIAGNTSIIGQLTVPDALINGDLITSGGSIYARGTRPSIISQNLNSNNEEVSSITLDYGYGGYSHRPCVTFRHSGEVGVLWMDTSGQLYWNSTMLS